MKKEEIRPAMTQRAKRKANSRITKNIESNCSRLKIMEVVQSIIKVKN